MLTDFNDFRCGKSWENVTSTACTFAHLTCILYPLYLGKSKKVIFQQYYPFIQIIYVISEENKLLPLYPPHLKMSPHYLVKCTTFSSDWRYVRFSERWWIWNEPVVCWHWWLWKELVVVCGKWNVRQATLQQMFKVTTFCTGTCFVFFATDQLYHPPCSAEIQPMSQQDAAVPQLVRIANWYSIHVNKWKKMKNLCILQGSGATFFRCSG